MTIDDKIRDEKLQYDINREVAKISALLSDKIIACLYSPRKGRQNMKSCCCLVVNRENKRDE